MLRYNKLFLGSAQFTAGSACTGLYRDMKLWEAAVREAATVD
jgi:branched-chain amino acid transport system substrate-binding protein